jgi:hypothetical protein
LRFAQALLLLLVLALLAPQVHATSCACRSGSASYDFLADPAVDIDMPTPEEFLSGVQEDSSQPYSEFLKDDLEENTSSKSKLSIDLDPDGHVDLLLSKSGGELSGSGNMVKENTTSEISARGSLENGLLKLDLVTLSGDLYKLDLSGKEPHLAGNYIAFSSDGKTWTGNATGIEGNV